MKKLFLGLFTLMFILVVVACDNDDTGGDVESDVNLGGDVSELPGDVQALLAEWDLPAPRFTPDADTPSWQLDQDHMVEITWYVNFGWWAPGQLGDDLITTVVREDLGIIINFISGDDVNLQAMMAAGDLPDIITMAGDNELTYQAYEFAFPLDVLSAIYDPYFMNHVVPSLVSTWHSLPNGHFYGMPNDAWYREAIEDGTAWPNAGFMVREDIYNAIGSVDMTTPEGFLTALRAAAQHMPYTDHGVPLVPFAGHALDMVAGGTGAFGETLQDFLAIPFVDEAGNWYDRDSNPEYLEWLLVFRQALEEGLMNNDQFSDDNSLIQERLSLGTYFAYITPNLFDVGEALTNNNNRGTDQVYIPVSGPRNSTGDGHTFPAGGLAGWTQTFVTTASIDPQTAMQVITYFSSDYGNMLTAFGVEGETFEWIDGLAVLFPEVAEVYGDYGLGRYWMLRNLAYTNRIGNLPNIAVQDLVAFSQQYNQARLEFASIDPVDGGALQRDIGYINTARTQAIVAVIQAPDDATGTQIWQEFLDSRENFSFEELTEFRNERIQSNRERLDMD